MSKLNLDDRIFLFKLITQGSHLRTQHQLEHKLSKYILKDGEGKPTRHFQWDGWLELACDADEIATIETKIKTFLSKTQKETKFNWDLLEIDTDFSFSEKSLEYIIQTLFTLFYESNYQTLSIKDDYRLYSVSNIRNWQIKINTLLWYKANVLPKLDYMKETMEEITLIPKNKLVGMFNDNENWSIHDFNLYVFFLVVFKFKGNISVEVGISLAIHYQANLEKVNSYFAALYQRAQERLKKLKFYAK